MNISDSIKYAGGLVVCIILRFAQIVPNAEPIMGFTLPYSKKYGWLAGGFFALVAMASFDFVSGRLGLWTIYTSLAYFTVGALAAVAFSKFKTVTRWHYAGYAALATVFFDAVTALMFGWQFSQPLAVTFAGQLPFTMYHLLGNVAFAAVVSPAIYSYVLASETPLRSGVNNLSAV